jgi:hypothetical protein
LCVYTCPTVLHVELFVEAVGLSVDRCQIVYYGLNSLAFTYCGPHLLLAGLYFSPDNLIGWLSSLLG